MIFLIIYCIISAVIIGWSIIPEPIIPEMKRDAGEICLDIFLILVSPIIFTVIIILYLLDCTVNRKKVKLAQHKDYQEVSNGIQKRLANCMKRYNDYFE